jgi:glycosyltransferase involved in cell wall biosynthesis
MRIALIDPYLTYRPRDAHDAPLGGTESSFVCLAEALGARHHDVHVYLKDPETHVLRGVSYHRVSEYGHAGFTAVIARWPHLFQEAAERQAARIWWCHKAVDPESVVVAQKFTVFPVLTSQFQAQQLSALNWKEGFEVIPLGCRMLGFPYDRTGRDPFAAVWMSAYDRGLSSFIGLWREIRCLLPPQRRLLIAGGPRVYREYGAYLEPLELELRRETRYEHDIVWAGALGPRELFRLLSSCGFMPYATNCAETFCLAALEAQAAGCLPIVTPQGALGEVVIHDRTGWIEAPERIGDRIVAYGGEALEPTVSAMRDAAREHASRFTWTHVALQFEKAINRCLCGTL